MKKTAIVTGILLVSLVVTLTVVSAEFWACVDYSKVVNYCNNYKPPRTCSDANGCAFCMSVYNATSNCYIHGAWPRCQTIPQECATGIGGNTTVDSIAPNITINNPTNGTIYNARAFMVDLRTSEESSIYYTDIDRGKGRWVPVCTDCLSYKGMRSFNDGWNNLQFRAKDVVGNEKLQSLSFFVDSTKPKLLKTEPVSGLANGDFSVQFLETNPKHLYITYGNSAKGFNFSEVNITKDCYAVRDKYYCEKWINLSKYNGMDITYTANITDVANNNAKSARTNILTIDTKLPNITSLTYTIDKKYANFRVAVDEINFNKLTYSYTDTSGKTRDGTLCSRLKGNICEKKMSFRTGHYDVSIQATDGAGNSFGKSVSFDIA